tara:strand:- start:1569 stop:2138 length:570 start_codon:yes stop_codon:yes gene_type:complete
MELLLVEAGAMTQLVHPYPPPPPPRPASVRESAASAVSAAAGEAYRSAQTRAIFLRAQWTMADSMVMNPDPWHPVAASYVGASLARDAAVNSVREEITPSDGWLDGLAWFEPMLEQLTHRLGQLYESEMSAALEVDRGHPAAERAREVDLQRIMLQANVVYSTAVEYYDHHGGDVVAAIVELSTSNVVD